MLGLKISCRTASTRCDSGSSAGPTQPVSVTDDVDRAHRCTDNRAQLERECFIAFGGATRKQQQQALHQHQPPHPTTHAEHPPTPTARLWNDRGLCYQRASSQIFALTRAPPPAETIGKGDGLLKLIAEFGVVLAGAAGAQTTNPYQLKGFTAATFQGNAGVIGFTMGCQGEFSAAARMCTSVEVLQTVVIPTGLSGTAWVRPVFQPVASGSSGTVLTDASGVEALSCLGWRLANGGGLTDAVGQFASDSFSAPCATARRVACCAPVPLPEPSAMLLNGVGFAALTLLSTSSRVGC